MTTAMPQFTPGACWASKDGKRQIVIDSEAVPVYRTRAFTIRNLATGRRNHIEINGLIRKFTFTGYDPSYRSGT